MNSALSGGSSVAIEQQLRHVEDVEGARAGGRQVGPRQPVVVVG